MQVAYALASPPVGPLLGALFGRPPECVLRAAPAGIRPSVRMHFVRSSRRWLRARDLLADAHVPHVRYTIREVCRALHELEAVGVIESRRREHRPGLGRKEYRIVAGIRRLSPDLCPPGHKNCHWPPKDITCP